MEKIDYSWCFVDVDTNKDYRAEHEQAAGCGCYMCDEQMKTCPDNCLIDWD